MHRKPPGDAHPPDRLRHEADVLHLARHPGVVEVLVEPELDEEGALVTAWAGDRTLDDLGPLRTEEVAGLVIALADTVADLHLLGVVHGRIEPSHVVMADDGRPVLCGFAGGGRIGTPPLAVTPPPAHLRDPFGHGPLQPTMDVFALGALLRQLLGAAGAQPEPIPERRFGARAARWGGYLPRALLTIADQATADDPLARPSARDVADALRTAVPAATLPRGPIGGADTADPFAGLRPEPRAASAPARQPATFVVAIVGIALLLFGVSGLRRGANPSPLDAPAIDAPAGAAPAITARPVVEADGARYEVGEPGDVVAVGDWDCDGAPTPAVLRPATGAVFAFTSWATAGQDAVAVPLTTIPGGRALVASADADGCDVLGVERPDGSIEAVAP